MENFNEAIAGRTPVLVDFYAVWCGPCKAMRPIVDEVERNFKGKAKVLTVNIDDIANRRLTALYNIRSVPTLIIFRDGVQHWRRSGVVDYEILKKELEKYIEMVEPEMA